MNKLILPQGATCLVVVAHPDDETIWLGGTIAANPQANWLILSMSRSSDTDRAPKFQRVANFFKAKGIIDDWDDDGVLNFNQSILAAKKIILKHFQSKHFDFIFTHGANGEYGHERHKGLHIAIKELLSAKKISTGALLAFNYKKISKYKLSAKADSDFIINLPKNIFQKKIEAMSCLYGFDPKGIDTGYSTNPEALKFIKY